MFKPKSRNQNRRLASSIKPKTKVFSYYGNQAQDAFNPKVESPLKLNRQKLSRRQHLRNAPTYLAIGLIVLSCLYALTLGTQPKILISNTSQSNSLVRSSETYQEAIHKLLAKSILNRNKFTIDTNALSKSIKSNFPEIEHATVTIPLLGKQPVIGLDPAVPELILVNQTDAYIIGRDGRALVNIKDLAANQQLLLPTAQDQSGLTLEQGKAVLPSDTVAFITTVVQQLKAKHYFIDSIVLPTIANELHVKPKDKSYLIKFNLQNDAKQQVGTLLAVIDKLNADNATPTEYIDVRIDERAYYK